MSKAPGHGANINIDPWNVLNTWYLSDKICRNFVNTANLLKLEILTSYPKAQSVNFKPTITTRLGLLNQSSSGSANAHLPGCFRPWTFPLNIGLKIFPSDSFMSCLDSLLGFLQVSSRLCNWLSLQHLLPWINHLPPVCWYTFWKSSLKC